MNELNLFTTSERLPPPLATAKRIAEVGGVCNSSLVAFFHDKKAMSGTVFGNDFKSRRIEISWKPDHSNYKILNFPVHISVKMDGLPVHLNNIVNFSDLNNPDQWKKLAETIGNLILDNTVHGNTGPDDSMFSGIENDPDIDATTLSIAASKLDQVGKTDGGTE